MVDGWRQKLTHGSTNISLAVLIDADNASVSIIEGLLTEVAKLGVASVKRIYGDWTTPNLAPWKPVLLEYSIQPVQQFRYTTGKNATDSAMIIDAMDLLYTGHFAGFCLVSSDSDFTRLAARIRESGRRVYGFGAKKTPKPFISACDKFTYTEIFEKKKIAGPTETTSAKQRTTKELSGDTKLTNLIRGGIDAASDGSGWASLSLVGGYIKKMSSDFDPKTYGFSNLSKLIAAIGLFESMQKDKKTLIREKKKKASKIKQD